MQRSWPEAVKALIALGAPVDGRHRRRGPGCVRCASRLFGTGSSALVRHDAEARSLPSTRVGSHLDERVNMSSVKLADLVLPAGRCC